jgi:hypothetical protein
VASAKLPPQVLQGRKAFDVTKSSSWTKLDDLSWRVQYGDDASANGYVGKDTVKIGDLVVPDVSIEIATSLTGSVQSKNQTSGLLGLGFPVGNRVQPKQQLPFFFKALPILKEPVFSMALKHGGDGVIEFGRIDPKYKDLAWYTSNKKLKWWTLPVTGYRFEGENISIEDTTVLDSGSSLTLLDQAATDRFYSDVKGARVDQSNYYIFPCESKLPPLEIILNGRITISIDGILLAEKPDPANKGLCSGVVQSMDAMGLPVQLLGNVFFKANYVVFNGQNSQIGIQRQIG